MTSASEVVTTTGGTRPDWARKYPPLLAIFVALAIVLAVLPSALNLPQSNPTQTLEYAPVPPDDQSNDAVQGNLGALGMGSSSGINGGGAAGGQGAGGGPLDIPPPPAVVEPGQQCVGKPPRQTVDPLSPPCVVGFDGDNFGATYQGVTDKEIRLLIYLDGGINYISSSDPSKRISPQDKYYDLFKTYATDDSEHPQHFLVDGLRVWQKYFNERFQRYKRNVHFFVYFSDRGNGATSDLRRQNAADNFAKVNPFAVISFATEGFEDAYLQAMARKGVLNFGSFGLRPASFFQQFPKLIWSYLPSVEQQTDSFVNYVCRKVAYPGATATMAGADLKDKPRTFGILHTTDEKQQGLILAANIVKDRLKKECNVDFAGEATYPACCLAQDNGEVPDYAGRSMAEFRGKNITTIIWTGGINGNFGKSANGSGYQPEWVIMGDGLLDGYYPVLLSQNSAAFDHHAVIVTPQVLQPAIEQQRCWQAFREIDQSIVDADLRYLCEFYTNLFQFFVGVQVAGPRLGPSSIDQGFHAIPQRTSGNPQVPACFYLPGDYTCIKDAEAMAWSASDRPPGANQAGCWRSIEAGARYLPKDWKTGDMSKDTYAPSDPCNGYNSSVRFNLR